MRRWRKEPALRGGWTRWVQPRPKNYLLVCCDCGLVHHVDFRVVVGKTQLRMKRAERYTAQNRKVQTMTDPAEEAIKAAAKEIDGAMIDEFGWEYFAEIIRDHLGPHMNKALPLGHPFAPCMNEPVKCEADICHHGVCGQPKEAHR